MFKNTSVVDTEKQDMPTGSLVRFSTAFYSKLIVRQMRGAIEHNNHFLDALMRDGMIVDGHPREGRINVHFIFEGQTSYRTYSKKDLVNA